MSKMVALAAVIVVLIATGLYFSGQDNTTGMSILHGADQVCPASCDDRISCTRDYCNDSYECAHEYICTQPECEDGTPFDSCSEEQPLYCDFDILVEKCTVCGCADEDSFCNEDNKSITYNRCVEAECFDDYDCDDDKLNTIDTCLDPYKVLSNGSSGAECSHELRVLGTLDIAIVEFSQPGLEYGKTYHFCSDEKGCFVYQEDDWNNLKDLYCGSDMSECNYTEYFDYISILNGEEKTTFDYECNIDRDNRGQCIYYSLRYLEDWFEREAFTYDKNLGVDIDIFGPYDTDSLSPHIADRSNCESLESYFRNELAKADLDLSNYDTVVYLYFTDSLTGKRFESCNTTDVYVSYSGVDRGVVFASDLTEVIASAASEILHRFGAVGSVLETDGPFIEDYALTDECAEEIGWK